MSDYVDVESAARARGMRLVLTRGVPGPWSESAKGILHVKRIPFVRVAQEAAAENAELKQWTGHSNAPVAVYDDEPPRSGWAEILRLAERIAPEPRLIPEDARLRATMFGYAHEICGELGFGWNRRLMMIDSMLPRDGDPFRGNGPAELLGRRYGYSRAAAAAAREAVTGILVELSRLLRAQRAAGSNYLIGDSLSALDIYWAAFAALIDPLPQAQCRMPDGLRAFYVLSDDGVRSAMDPALMAHRDFVYERYLELPLQL